MNKTTRIIIVLAVAAVAAAAFVAKERGRSDTASVEAPANVAATTPGDSAAPIAAKLPRLLDLGADKCIPCKMMAPILAEFQRDYADQFVTEFIDVWKNPDAGKQYGVEMIPTQIFFDADGKELFRHVGFYGKEDMLAKWKEFGVGIAASGAIVRETPIAPDNRPRDAVCHLCDGDIHPQTRTVVQGQAEQRNLCSPHCYFIYFSSIVGAEPAIEDAKVSVTDWAGAGMVPATTAVYLHGLDAAGRPTIKAFADKDAALREQQTSAGNLLSWDVLRSKEMATRCAFCDRAVYPEDACAVKFGATHGYGCCTHCSLGVAARLKQDVEVVAKDGFSGEVIRVRTLDGGIASIEPPTAIAWYGQIRGLDGKWISAGCFKQGFFANQANLQRWLDARPAMTGREITIAQALADKMKLTPEQIAKACKLGECK